jgi:hypothetical protein
VGSWLAFIPDPTVHDLTCSKSQFSNRDIIYLMAIAKVVTYFLTYPFRSHFTITLQKTPFLFTSIFSYCRVKDQHPQTYRIARSNLYLNTFLKWQAHLKCFRHLRMVLSHYINISSLKMDYYIPIT